MSGRGDKTVSVLVRTPRALILTDVYHRYPHHQHWKDMGETRLCCSNHCRHREPERRLRDLRTVIRAPRSTQIRRQHRCTSDRRTIHPRFIHELHHAFLQGAPPDRRDGSARGPPSDPRGLLREHPRHRARRHGRSPQVRRCGDPDEQQGASLGRPHLVAPRARGPPPPRHDPPHTRRMERHGRHVLLP